MYPGRVNAPRILFGALFHETHSFVADRTSWGDFTVACDQAVLDKIGDASPTDGFLEQASRYGWEVVPTLDARAMPSGLVEDEAFEIFWREFESRARPALRQGVDAVFLVLHGAMATVSETDIEGELLARLRRLPGAAALPIFGVLDLHANVTPRMCALANGLVLYRENPHTDAKVAAARAAGLLHRCLSEGRVPRMAWGRAPILWAPPGTGTEQSPMRELEAEARRMEAGNAEVWACNIAAGFSFTDSPWAGFTISLITTAADIEARRLLDAGARLAWAKRAAGEVRYPPALTLLKKLALQPPRSGPVLLVEPSDNVGGGAPGDGTGVLRALLAQDVSSGLVAINDPAAVQSLAGATLQTEHTLEIGGRGWSRDEGPVRLRVTLLSRSDGRFELGDKQSHLASMMGAQIDMGPCAVVRAAGVVILLTSRKTPPFDLGQFRSQGIEPRDFSYIGVKAAVGHKRAYDAIAPESYYVDTPGPCSSTLASFPWRHLQRPVWPLDLEMDYRIDFA